MALINGSDVRLYLGGAAVAYATNCTFSMETEFIELAPASVDAAAFRRVRPRRTSGSMSVTALYSENGPVAGESLESSFSEFIASNSFEVQWRSGIHRYYATGYVENIQANAAAAQIASWSVKLILTGEIQFQDFGG